MVLPKMPQADTVCVHAQRVEHTYIESEEGYDGKIVLVTAAAWRGRERTGWTVYLPPVYPHPFHALGETRKCDTI